MMMVTLLGEKPAMQGSFISTKNMDDLIKKAYYFIPDISGFSGFVENTAIEHSIHIVSELLEILLDNNVLEMKLAEVEGDALFMYAENHMEFPQLENQISKMLNAFRKHLHRYQHQRICNCGACSTAIDLKIKFLVHYGRLDFIKVKQIRKPYGKDVNRIHRLLKNDVPLDEYLLLSNPSLEQFKLDPETSGFRKLESQYNIRILPYYYKDLATYKTDFKEKASKESRIGIDKKAEVVVEREIAVPITKVFELVSNFKYRKQWDRSLTEIHYDDGQVNRIGSRHTCIIGNKKLNFETIGNNEFMADQVYAENTASLPMTSDYKFYILLDKVNETTTGIKVLNFIELDWLGRIFKKRIHRKINTNWNKKLRSLEVLALSKSNAE